MPVVMTGIGAESILEQVEIALMADINDALEVVYTSLEDQDTARALRRGIEYTPITWDPVPPDHFHVGNFPRQVLSEVPAEFYPYIVLAVEDMVPDAESANLDHTAAFRQALVVHSLASATNDEGSEIVYRRALRMGEAVHMVLVNNKTTRNMLKGIVNPTRGQSSVPWTYRENGRNENRAWYQAVGISYMIKFYTTNHS
jgi:putative lipoic acid-binding regulatory protein